MKASLFSIDPGKWVSGIAAFDSEGYVLRATEISIPIGCDNPACTMADHLYAWAEDYSDKPSFIRWVVEEMIDYEGKLARNETLDDLRDIAAMLSLRHGCKVKELAPRAWKGQVPKHVIFTRIGNKLSRTELVAIDPFEKEALDAVGIGLVESGRFNRGITGR